MNFAFTVDDFECSLSKTDASLTIRAEDIFCGNVFSKTLNNDDAKAILKEKIFDINTIFQVIKDFFENNPNQVSLSITREGQLTYSCRVFFGNVAREYGFTIPLEKEDLEPLNKMEKAIERLLARIADLEKSVKINEEKTNKIDLPKLLKANDERFHTFEKLFLGKLEKIENILIKTEKRVAALEKANRNAEDLKDARLEILQFTFNPSAQFANKFSLSNENKTAVAKSEGCFSIYAENSLPKSRKVKFSCLVESVDSFGLGFGITNKNAFSKQGLFNERGSLMYFSGSKTYFYADGSIREGILPVLKRGDEVSFIADMQTGAVVIILNNNQVGTHTFQRADLELKEFFPFIHSQNKGNGATFI